MAETYEAGNDGLPKDDVSHDPADTHDMQTFIVANGALSKFQSPLLVHADRPHEKLFVVSFDGTGNNGFKDPEHATNVARVDRQIEALKNNQIKGKYVEGIGTQDNAIARGLDGATGLVTISESSKPAKT
jgi:hypothetical protein